MTQAKAEAIREEEAGVDVAALEQAARLALANGAFEENEEEVPAIVEEFYPENEDPGEASNENKVRNQEKTETGATSKPKLVPMKTKLTDRLGTPPSATPAAQEG